MEAVKVKAQKTRGALVNIYYTMGGQLVETVLNIIGRKVFSQLLCDVEICGSDLNSIKVLVTADPHHHRSYILYHQEYQQFFVIHNPGGQQLRREWTVLS